MHTGRYRRITVLAALGLSCAGWTTRAHAAEYTYTKLYKCTGTTRLDTAAINGQVVSYSAHSVWNYPSNIGINLTPFGFSVAHVRSTDGYHQVGDGISQASFPYSHAMLWSGTADSVVDLNPNEFISSYATNIKGNQQVGFGDNPTSHATHALLWTGSAASAVDLNPSWFEDSYAYGTSGDQQVGCGVSPDTYPGQHALLWSGTADSAIDISPSWMVYCVAVGCYSLDAEHSQQVGCGYKERLSDGYHALLWSGTADSMVDLHPSSGFVNSYATSTNGYQQIGYGYPQPITSKEHALVWSGTAESVVDLHSLLPTSYSDSRACSIDAHGNIFGWAFDTSLVGGGFYVIEWSPVPEPATLASAALLAGMGGLIRPRRRR